MVLEKERKKKTRIVCTIGPASEDKKRNEIKLLSW